MSRVGEKIKSARLQSSMTQKVLAKKLGVAEKFINEVECGRRILNEALIEKISKVLNADLNDVSMVATDEELSKEKVVSRKVELKPKVAKLPETDEVWNQAFGSVLKNVPIYDYDLSTVKGYRQLPIHSNKIEGHAPDKVFYLVINDDDMLGFRISKGDVAFCHSIKEAENNAICLIEYNQGRAIRQIKKLDNTKVLLVSNKCTVRTEAVSLKDIKFIAKLNKVEVLL